MPALQRHGKEKARVTTVCQLCGTVITADTPPATVEIPADVRALQEFDHLASHMSVHLTQHHPFQAQEQILIMHRAAKMYAMNWTYEQGPEREALKQQWRMTLLIALSVRTQREGDATAGSSDSPPEPPEGSNEKNSSRNPPT